MSKLDSRVTRACLVAALLLTGASLLRPSAGGERAGRSAPGEGPRTDRSAAEAPVPPRQAETPAERGYRLLRTKPYLPPDFDQDVFEDLWTVWPEPLREEAREATPEQRRRMAFSRYGLVEPPEDGFGRRTALGWVADEEGGWTMNCLACHAGRVAGRTILGLPNSHFALETLIEDVRRVKAWQLKQPSHLELGSLKMPLGTTNGTTNAVVFGIALGSLRDADMNVDLGGPKPKLIHHDMDAPPLWNVSKKSMLYCDGHAAKTHRLLLQFILVPSNDGETVRGWEDDYRDILAWIESLEPPRYPWPIDRDLAAEGRAVFGEHCSRCHGSYGAEERYPEKRVPLDVVGTDPVRLRALRPEDRRRLRKSWMSHYGRKRVVVDPGGYVAPPHDGIWASAPYFHNGSVPTLWHVLHPDRRPPIWKRTEDGYDRAKVGLEIETYEKVPGSAGRAQRRRYFDTRGRGKSAAGHRFPEALTEPERRAVLEYLKTL